MLRGNKIIADETRDGPEEISQEIEGYFQGRGIALIHAIHKASLNGIAGAKDLQDAIDERIEEVKRLKKTSRSYADVVEYLIVHGLDNKEALRKKLEEFEASEYIEVLDISEGVDEGLRGSFILTAVFVKRKIQKYFTEVLKEIKTALDDVPGNQRLYFLRSAVPETAEALKGIEGGFIAALQYLPNILENERYDFLQLAVPEAAEALKGIEGGFIVALKALPDIPENKRSDFLRYAVPAAGKVAKTKEELIEVLKEIKTALDDVPENKRSDFLRYAVPAAGKVAKTKEKLIEILREITAALKDIPENKRDDFLGLAVPEAAEALKRMEGGFIAALQYLPNILENERYDLLGSAVPAAGKVAKTKGELIEVLREIGTALDDIPENKKYAFLRLAVPEAAEALKGIERGFIAALQYLPNILENERSAFLISAVPAAGKVAKTKGELIEVLKEIKTALDDIPGNQRYNFLRYAVPAVAQRFLESDQSVPFIDFLIKDINQNYGIKIILPLKSVAEPEDSALRGETQDTQGDVGQEVVDPDGDPAALGESGQEPGAKAHPTGRQAADRPDPAALGTADDKVENPGGSPSADLTKGGIDVRKMEDVLKTKGKGFVFDPAVLGVGGVNAPDFQNLPGLTPVIFQINIVPLQDLPAVFLGIRQKEPEKERDLSLLGIPK